MSRTEPRPGASITPCGGPPRSDRTRASAESAGDLTMTFSAAPVRNSSDASFPLRLNAFGAFGTIQDALRKARFDEDTICGALGIQSMADVGTVAGTELDLKTIPSQTLALY